MKLSESAALLRTYLTEDQKQVLPAPEDSALNWGEILERIASGGSPPFETKGIITPFGVDRFQSISHFVFEMASVLSQVAA